MDGNSLSSSVSTSSLLSEGDSLTQASVELASPPAGETTQLKDSRRKIREERRHAVLTDVTLEDLCVFESLNFPPKYRVPNAFHCVRGSFSQFLQAAPQQQRQLLPPLTHDCCQTFSTLAAVLFSSFGRVVMFQECWNVTSINYVVYVAAWLHQLTLPLRNQRSRPTIRELNECLALPLYFPAQIDPAAFIVLFYNQGAEAQRLIRQLCTPQCSAGASEVCGYVIVSGEYTVSVFCLQHDVAAENPRRFSAAWNLYIADSHGTLPWAQGRASVSSLCLGVPLKGPSIVSVDDGPVKSTTGHVFDMDDGIHHFSCVLFSLLEDHRKLKKDVPTTSVPYMTWTPIRRPQNCVHTCKELTNIINLHWIPHVFSNDVVRSSRDAFGGEHPRACFWGLSTHRSTKRQPVVVEEVRPTRVTVQTTLTDYISSRTAPSQAVEMIGTADAPCVADDVPPSLLLKRHRVQ